MEFKGTKGKWVINKRHQTIEDSEGYGIAQTHGIKNDDKWLNNALLISKAPEMLEILENMYKEYSNNERITGSLRDYMIKIGKLIKEATEL